MSEIENRKLSDLRVIDLKHQLEKRGLDKHGVKKDLVERLQKALQDEGIDPENFIYKTSSKKIFKHLSSSSTTPDEAYITELYGEFVKDEYQRSQVSDNAEKEKSPEKEEIVQEPEKPEEKSEEHSEQHSEQSEISIDWGERYLKQLEAEASINLTLEDEENINEEHVEQLWEKSKKSKQDSDMMTTTPTDRDSTEVPMDSTNASPQQDFKKAQDVDTGTNTSSQESTPSPRKAQSNPRLLWITNVPKNTRANELKQLLSPCGKVVCAKVVVNARFPGSCCFGYVTMGSAEDASNVITKLNNTEFNGQIIKIDKFANINAGALNSSPKKGTDENKKSPTEKREDKSKSSESKTRNEEAGTSAEKEKSRIRKSSERRKSITSDRSSRSRRRTHSRERLHERDRPGRSTSRGANRIGVLTFDKIKEERERQRMRDREREMREDSRRRHEEELRLREMREISRRQRNEAERLEREREKLRIERDKIEREKSELLKLERERQKAERERLEREKRELERSRLQLEQDRRAVKRPASMTYRREEFEDRKRPTNDRHFEENSHFNVIVDPSELIPVQKFAPKDFKKLPFDKPDYSSKRARDYNSERPHSHSSINRSNTSHKFGRFDNVRERESRSAGSRESHSNTPMRSKDSRYVDKDRNPHFRNLADNRDRHVSQGNSERGHHYSEPTGSKYSTRKAKPKTAFAAERWNHPPAPQSKFLSGNQKSWGSKGGNWRADAPNTDRWNSSTSSGRGLGMLGQQFSGNSSSSTCPPPPGINNYSDRFDYNKSSSIRKY